MTLFQVLVSDWFVSCPDCRVVKRETFNDVQICAPHREHRKKIEAEETPCERCFEKYMCDCEPESESA
jgi:hypothetical protein